MRPKPARRREPSPGWTVGVDLGGTRVRVLAVHALARRRWALSGPAPGLSGLPALLRRLWRRWGLRRVGVRGLAVATRGVRTPAERRTQEQRLAGLAQRVRVMSDVEAAYQGAFRGARGTRPGVLVLSGTGAIALGGDGHGRWRRAGGLGPLLGDEGSAFWIGRQWLRAMTDADLSRVRQVLGATDAAARIAAHAPRVLRRARRGDPTARRIVVEAQGMLAGLLLEVARGLGLPPPVSVSWAGSLMEEPRFRAGVWRAARRAGLAVAPRAPRERPVTAAAGLASRLGGELARRSMGAST